MNEMEMKFQEDLEITNGGGKFFSSARNGSHSKKVARIGVEYDTKEDVE